MPPIVRAFLLGCALAGPAGAAEPAPIAPAARPSPPAMQRTGKERLSDKASDEQRVDDCKVRPERRTRARPSDCTWEVGS